MRTTATLSKKKKLAFAAVTLVLALLGLELVARAVFWIRSPRDVPPVVVRRFHPLRYELRPGSSIRANGATASINALGFRGPEPSADEDRIRILCLGDSCTFGYASDVTDRKTYPALLGEKLEKTDPGRFSVLNGGMLGFGSLDCLSLFVAKGETLRPDVVVVLAGWNDHDLVQDLGGPVQPKGFELERVSALARLFRVAIRKVRGSSPETGQDVAGLRNQAEGLPPPTARLSEEGFAVLERTLDAIVAVVRDQGAVPILVTYPNFTRDEWTESAESLTDKELRRMLTHLASCRLSPKGWREFITRTNEAIASVARRRNVRLVDGTSLRNPRWFVDACHLTAEGNDRLAEKVAKVVREATASEVDQAE